MKQTLNIPHKLMKRCRKDKSLWELFIFAVCIKINGKGDSKISTEVKDVRKLMGCSYYKAVRMIEGAKQCPELFFVYENGKYIVARSFTHNKLEKRVFHTKKREYAAYCAKCFRFEYDDSKPVRHIEMSRKLRDGLITDAIMATQSADGSNPINSSTRPTNSRPITLQALAKVSGYHYTTVLKHLKKMESCGKVESKKGELVTVLHLETGEVLTDDESCLRRKIWYDWHGYRFVRQPNRYAVVKANKDDRAVNIIFNHRRRHKKNVSAKPKQRENESRIDFVNRTILGHLWL